MKIRRFLAIIFALLLCLGVCACASGEDASSGDSGSSVAENSESSEEEASSEQQSGTDRAEDDPEEESSGVEQENHAVTAEELLAQMTLQEKIYQLFVVRPESLIGADAENDPVMLTDARMKDALASYPVGGVALFGKNIVMPSQTKKLIAGLQDASPIPLLIGVDEEGGLVARLGNNAEMGTTSFPDMMSIGDSGDVLEAYRVGFTIGSEIKEFGFNLDFAPVADVYTNPDNTVIGTRAFSSDPQIAAEMVAQAVTGFSDAGMISCLKHFPGHGDTAEDSHTSMAVTYKTLDELRACEFVPFSAGIEAGAEMVMIGHITAAEADESGLPATMSRFLLTDILRGELGFDGLIITDSMEMEAVAAIYTPAESAVLAVQAGADIVLMPTDLPAAANGILDAVEEGTLTEARIDESVLRILKCKEKYGILGE